MFHYFGTCQNTKGDALSGWFVEVVSIDTSVVVDIYSDEAGTPISSSSGVENRAKTDNEGNYDFFVNDGDYSLKFYNQLGVFQRTQRYLPMYGNLSGSIAEGIATITAAEATAVASAASASADAATATAQATSASSSATAANTSASNALQAALTAQGFSNTLSAAASGLPFEVTAISGGVGTGTGGTNGVYNLGVTGGPAGFKATVTISGGTIASYQIVNPGLATTNAAPTLSLSAVPGLTGATTPTATVGTIPVNRVFFAPDSAGALKLAWINNAGALASYPVGGTQYSEYFKSGLDTLTTTLTDWTPKTLTYTSGQRVKSDGTTEAASGYAIFGCAIDSSDREHQVTVFGVASGWKTASYYSDPAGSTASFISASTEGGGALQTQLTLTPPSNARYVRINSNDFPSANYVPVVYETRQTIATASLVADTRARLLTASSVPLATAPTINLNQRLFANGTVSSATGYGNALVVLAADTTALVIDTWVIGTGNPAIVWYSDTGGTTMLQPGSQVGGAPVRVTGTIARPAGALSARVAFSTTNPYSIRRLKRITSVEEVLSAFNLTGVAAALSGPLRQTPPGGILTSTRIAPNTGATETATGYSAAFFPVTDLTLTYQASGDVIGASRRLATYYSDSAGTVYLGQEYSGTAVRDKVTLNPPAGTLCIGINGSPTVAPQLFVNGIPTGMAAKMDVVDRLTSTWAGKKLTTEGDSITAQNRWQALLVNRLGMAVSYANTGVSGTRVAYRSGAGDDTSCMCDDARVNAIPTDTDLLIFMAGTNDHGQNIALGSLTAYNVRSAGSFNGFTFYGALELAALKQKTRLPTKRILWASQTYVDRAAVLPSGWSNSFTNTQGLTQWDYVAAMEAVALKWGIPFVNMIRECGWDSTNMTTYLLDEGGGSYIHPNQTGGNVMAGVFYAAARRLEVIT